MDIWKRAALWDAVMWGVAMIGAPRRGAMKIVPN